MNYIFKHHLPMNNESGIISIKLPEGALICDFHEQKNEIYVWALIDVHASLKTHTFRIIGTGWKIDNLDEWFFQKTVHMNSIALKIGHTKLTKEVFYRLHIMLGDMLR